MRVVAQPRAERGPAALGEGDVRVAVELRRGSVLDVTAAQGDPISVPAVHAVHAAALELVTSKGIKGS